MTDRDERVREIAYFLWLDAGSPEGEQERHWLAAEGLIEPEPVDPEPVEAERLRAALRMGRKSLSRRRGKRRGRTDFRSDC